MKQLLHTPEGVRDIYNAECERKLLLQNDLHMLLKNYGYHAIQTPTFEFFDIFSKGIGTTSSKELYKFFDRDGNTLVLRPDITPSVARSAAKYFVEETMPIRLFYMGNTFINNSSYQGRLKESTQIGAELIQDNSIFGDAEIIALAINSLLKSGLKDFQVSLGEVEFFNNLLLEAQMEEEDEELLRDLISNKNHFGVDELLERLDVSLELKQILTRIPELFGSFDILEEAKTMISNEKALSAIKRLEDVYTVLSYYGLERYVSFDLGMLGKYNYYTGMIFRAYTFGSGEPILKGGRYDNLLSHFGKEAPSIGFAIVIDQLMAALSRQKIEIVLKEEGTVVLYDSKAEKEAIQFATKCRNSDRSVELILFDSKKTIREYEDYAKQNHRANLIFISDQKEIKEIW